MHKSQRKSSRTWSLNRRLSRELFRRNDYVMPKRLDISKGMGRIRLVNPLAKANRRIAYLNEKGL